MRMSLRCRLSLLSPPLSRCLSVCLLALLRDLTRFDPPMCDVQVEPRFLAATGEVLHLTLGSASDALHCWSVPSLGVSTSLPPHQFSSADPLSFSSVFTHSALCFIITHSLFRALSSTLLCVRLTTTARALSLWLVFVDQSVCPRLSLLCMSFARRRSCVCSWPLACPISLSSVACVRRSGHAQLYVLLDLSPPSLV